MKACSIPGWTSPSGNGRAAPAMCAAPWTRPTTSGSTRSNACSSVTAIASATPSSGRACSISCRSATTRWTWRNPRPRRAWTTSPTTSGPSPRASRTRQGTWPRRSLDTCVQSRGVLDRRGGSPVTVGAVMALKNKPSPRKRPAARALNGTPESRLAREDWLTAALDALISDGVENVKVLPLAERLGVSRSSFYWFFRSREHLLDLLLERWRDSNTRVIVVEKAAAPSATITQGVLNIFICWMDESLFDPRLDFAVREWARRSGHVRRAVDQADDERVDAIKRMFIRHGLPRARRLHPGARALFHADRSTTRLISRNPRPRAWTTWPTISGPSPHGSRRARKWRPSPRPISAAETVRDNHRNRGA